MQTPNLPAIRALRPARNKGRIVGPKLTLVAPAANGGFEPNLSIRFFS